MFEPWTDTESEYHACQDSGLSQISKVIVSTSEQIVADVAQWVSAPPFELEGRQFDPCRSVDVCFDFPLFCVAVALNTRKTKH